MEYIQTKTLLSKVKKEVSGYWFGVDYNMNLYRGCNHGCIYCDSRSDCYQVKDFDTVHAKKDALQILEKECANKRKKGVVGIGAMSDTYNPFERVEFLTRGALEILYRYGFGVNIETKSDLIVRDIDILSKIAEKQSVLVKFTITCADDELCQKIEPFVVPTSKRLKAIKELSDAGINVGVILMPVLPFITDNIENIRAIVKLSAEHGAKFIYPGFGVTLRENQRDYYYQQLDRLFVGYKEKYQRNYGVRYSCQANSKKLIEREFKETCKQYGLIYQMKDIIKLYKKEREKTSQLTLF